MIAYQFSGNKCGTVWNLDGGGSSALYVKAKPTDKKGKLINNPVGYGYSGERYLPNAWMVLPSKKK